MSEQSNIKTWPERIYLQHGDSPEVPAFHEVYPGNGYSDGVTWCQDRIEAADVEYVRVDLAAAPVAAQEPVLERFKECCGSELETPWERLKFFCSGAMSGQDWLDSEPFFDDVEKQLASQPAQGTLCRPHSLPDCLWCRREAEASQPAQGEQYPITEAILEAEKRRKFAKALGEPCTLCNGAGTLDGSAATCPNCDRTGAEPDLMLSRAVKNAAETVYLGQSAQGERKPVGYKMVHERPGSDIGFAWTEKIADELFGPGWTRIPLYEEAPETWKVLPSQAKHKPAAYACIVDGAWHGAWKHEVDAKEAGFATEKRFDLLPLYFAALLQPAPDAAAIVAAAKAIDTPYGPITLIHVRDDGAEVPTLMAEQFVRALIGGSKP